MFRRSRKPQVLIVEDSISNIDVLVDALEDRCELSVALSGAEALKAALSENPPDLILLDILMPEMDGYEVCRRLKEDSRTQNIPVIFITALSTEEDETKGLECGAIDYIRKPVSKPIVRARVKNHWELKRHRDLLEDLSAIDGLTCIANRRRFDDSLEREWRRCARSGASLSLIMLDLDFFKAYNDNYGHVAGDTCLKMVAQTMECTLTRAFDLAARYGGDEFAALLSGADAQGALIVARSLQEEIAALEIEHAQSEISDLITVSMGVATASPSGDTAYHGLLKAADKALYEAKNNGRDRMKTCVLE